MNVSRRSVALTGALLVAVCAATTARTVSQTGPGRGSVQNELTSALAPAPQSTLLVAGEIYAGPGYSDASPHQLVRSASNVLYIAVPSCVRYPFCPGNSIAMEAGNAAGTPRSFIEQDAAHRPTSPTQNDNIGSTALALDGHGLIWVAYNTRNRGIHVVPFDTATNRWGVDQVVYAGPTGGNQVSQGKEGIAMVVDHNDTPHVVFTFVGTDGRKHVGISEFEKRWLGTYQIDDAPLGAGQGALHPTAAYTSYNHLIVAWLVGNETATYNNPDGTIYVREFTSNHLGPHSVKIPDTNYQGHPGYAATTIDQGPSLMSTADGVVELSYIDTSDAIRFWYSNGRNYQSWNGSLQPARQETHDPSLGPDGHGGLYIYGHGTPIADNGTPDINGHGNNLYRLHLPAGSRTWSPFLEIVADRNLDCSVSTRWSQFYNYYPTEVDYTYWDDHYANLEYVTNY